MSQVDTEQKNGHPEVLKMPEQEDGGLHEQQPPTPQLDGEQREEKASTLKKVSKVAGKASQGWYEAVTYNEMPFFLLRDSKRGVFSLQKELQEGRKLYLPRSGTDEIPYLPYEFKEDFGRKTLNGGPPSKGELFDRTRAELTTFLDYDSIWYDVYAAEILLTYQQEKLTTVPYQFIVGDNEVGKTTVQNLFGVLSYRPMVSVGNPVADIYTYLEATSDVIPTIIEDEIQGIDEDTEKVKIFKSGYKKGAKVARTVLLKEGRKQEFFNTFCFKLVGGEQLSSNKGLMQRCIIHHASKGYPKKEFELRDADLSRFMELRRDLLLYRLQTRDEQLPDIHVPLRGRIRELWKPLLQVVYGLPVYNRLLEFVSGQVEERKRIEQNSLEGQLVKLVYELRTATSGRGNIRLSNAQLWDGLASQLEATRQEYNPNVMYSSELGEISKRRLARIIQDKLRGEPTHVGSGNDKERGYAFDGEILRRMWVAYGFGGTEGTLGTIIPEAQENEEHNNSSQPKQDEERDEEDFSSESVPTVPDVPTPGALPTSG